MSLVLASASPRRQELLERIGIALLVRPASVDESMLAGEAPLVYVARVAAAKADVVYRAIAAETGAGAWVLGADTIVEIDGRVLGKAADEAEAAAMLGQLVGRVHQVSTGFAIRGPDGAGIDRIVTTRVSMRAAGAAEIADYVAAGEWRGKAGAYAVQGMAAALVIEIHGSITNVIGLPLAEVVAELSCLGAGEPRYGLGIPA